MLNKKMLLSHRKDDALTRYSELSIGKFSVVNNQTRAGTIVHFSIHPNDEFSFQDPNIACQIGKVQTSEALLEATFALAKKDSTERRK